jgi:hypothetical protein
MLTTAPRAEPSAADAPAVAALESTALAATRAAAIACRRWVGRGCARDADAAVAEAMHATLAEAPGRGTVVVGEGTKDDAPMLYDGERLGRGRGAFDIAVDPLRRFWDAAVALDPSAVDRDEGRCMPFCTTTSSAGSGRRPA